ncbi:MAG: secretin N-terminal domain-containing protein [Planctomycetales bacterium]
MAALLLAAAAPASAVAQDLRGALENLLGGGSDGGDPAPAAATAVELLQRTSVQTELKLNNDQLPRVQAIIEDQKRQVEEFDRSQKEQLRGMSIGERIRKGAEFKEALRVKTAETQAAASQQIVQLLDDEQRAALDEKLKSAPAATPGPAAGGDSGDSGGSRGSSGPDRGRSGSTFGRGETPAASAAAPARPPSPSPAAGPSAPPPRRDPNLKVVASFAPADWETIAAYAPASAARLDGSAGTAGVRSVAQAAAAAPEAPAGNSLPAAVPSPPPVEASSAASPPSPNEQNSPSTNGAPPVGVQPGTAAIQRVPGNGAAAGKLSFNFQNAPWTDVLKLFAEAAGLTLNLRDVPPGDFTYLDPQHYTPTEALDLMNRYLLGQGFILMRNERDRFLTAFNLSNGVPGHLVETVDLHELPERGRYELLRVQLPVGDRDPKKAESEVRLLLTKAGVATLIESANTVVVTDIAENLMRIRSIMQGGIAIGPGELIFRRFPLRHVAADDAAQVVQKLFRISTATPNLGGDSRSDRSRGSGDRSRGGRDGRGGDEDPRARFLRAMMGGDESSDRGGNDSGSPPPAGTPASRNATVVAHPGTNSVMVTATPADVKLAEQILVALDVDPENEPGFVNREAFGQAFLQVYELKTADPTRVAETLLVLHPGSVQGVDTKSNRIHVTATPAQHQEIAMQVRQFDGGMAGESLTLIPLNGVDPYGTMTALNGLWTADPEGAPAVQVDPTGQNLIVKGNATQVMQIDSLVKQLAANGGGSYQSGRAYRVVGLESATAPAVEQMLKDIYPQIVFQDPVPTQQPNQQSNATPRRDRVSPASRGGATGGTQRGAPAANADADARRAAFLSRMQQQGGGGNTSRFTGGGGNTRGGERGGRGGRGR